MKDRKEGGGTHGHFCIKKEEEEKVGGKKCKLQKEVEGEERRGEGSVASGGGRSTSLYSVCVFGHLSSVCPNSKLPHSSSPQQWTDAVMRRLSDIISVFKDQPSYYLTGTSVADYEELQLRF